MIMRWLLLLLWMLIPIRLSAQESPTQPIPQAFKTSAYRQDGNRVVGGNGTFPHVEQYTIPLNTSPQWLIGSPVGDNDAVWVIVDTQGQVMGALRFDNQYSVSEPIPPALPAGMPPVLASDTLGAFIDTQFPVDAALQTHAIRIYDRTAYINQAGQLQLLDENNTPLARFEPVIAPDARIVLSDMGLLAVYADYTDTRYSTGVLGDNIEGHSLLVVDIGFGELIGKITLPEPQVFEGNAPFWADINGDGLPDLVTTVSDDRGGPRIRAYQPDGTLIAEGPAIGRGGYWRHQLAWANFGVNGEMMLAEVLTPHHGGIVGFFRYDGHGRFERVGRADGYTSHVIHTRNLDMAIAGDFDGDGQAELVLSNQERNTLVSLALDAENNLVERWSFPLNGVLMTNISPVELHSGQLALAVGVQSPDGTFALKIFTPSAE
jgi:hypothetical protein